MNSVSFSPLCNSIDLNQNLLLKGWCISGTCNSTLKYLLWHRFTWASANVIRCMKWDQLGLSVLPEAHNKRLDSSPLGQVPGRPKAQQGERSPGSGCWWERVHGKHIWKDCVVVWSLGSLKVSFSVQQDLFLQQYFQDGAPKFSRPWSTGDTEMLCNTTAFLPLN